MFVSAMQQVGIKPPVVYDELSQYLEDRGYRRGRRRGLKQGRQQGREQGQAEGLQRALLTTYEARFGAVPPAVTAVVEAEGDPEILLGWQVLFSTRSARAIASAIRRSGGGEAG